MRISYVNLGRLYFTRSDISFWRWKASYLTFINERIIRNNIYNSAQLSCS
nr:MAG TPA: hypothetical protein [Caudoviricetes sp.]